MKKILLLILCSVLLLCSGCIKKETVKNQNDISAHNVYEEKTNKNSENKKEKEKLKINKDVYSDIGAYAEDIIELHGKIKEAQWDDGPIYRFSDSDIWYTFDDYETEGDSYIAKGKCTSVIVPIYELIDSPDDVYDIDSLTEATGSKVTRSYLEMYQMYCYDVEYDGYRIRIFDDNDGNISEDSNAEISKIAEK